MTNHPNRSKSTQQARDASTDWALSLVAAYSVPDYLFEDWDGALETLYRRLRDHCRDEYGSRRKIERQALRRAVQSDYVRPGVNFYIGATQSERRDDQIAGKIARRATGELERARLAMDEYEAWTGYKHLLAILTGRLDGDRVQSGSRGPDWAEQANADVARAWELRCAVTGLPVPPPMWSQPKPST